MAVLEDLSFRVAPDTVCSILGPGGAGKSTLADLRHAVVPVDQAPTFSFDRS